MKEAIRNVVGLAIVILGMAPLFAFPKDDFALATIIATSCMTSVAVALGGYRRLFAPSVKTVAVGLVSAAGLYLIFFLGNGFIALAHPFGIGPQSETSIYGLISSPGNSVPIQFLVLAFDSLGFESYFRGTLQKRLSPRIGVASPFATALLDASIHVASLNPLWVVATFIADSVWGMTYYRTGDLSSSMTSHFVWDVAIFIIRPIG